MSQSFERIVAWNKAAGLLDSGYNDALEASFQIEEALEGFNIPAGENPKEYARRIVSFWDSGICIADVDRLDKALDAIVFAVGSLAKLGLTGEQINTALMIVMDANDAKLGCEKDSHGKLMKPENFPNPEPRLQKLLGTRNVG